MSVADNFMALWVARDIPCGRALHSEGVETMFA